MTLNTLALLAAPQGQGGIAPMLIMWTLIIGIFYFLLIRPQRKAQERHQQMIAALRKGDHVMTEGGILGEVVHLKEDRVTIRTGENTRLVVARPKIARVLAGEEPT